VRRLLLLLMATGALLAVATPASAHPFLLFTTPTANTAVADSPESVVLVFNERVTAGTDAVVLVNARGRSTSAGPVHTARDGAAVTASIPGSLPNGDVTVRWRVTGEDGDLVEGEFRFAIGAAPPTASGSAGGPGINWGPAGLRWVLFSGLAFALGGVVARRSTALPLAKNPALRAVRSWTALGALVGLAASVGLAVPLIGDVGTDFWREQPGQLLLVETIGFAAAAVLAWRRQNIGAAVALTVVIVAEGLRSHADVASPGWGAVLTAVHLAAAAIWVGALVHVVRTAVAWRGHRAAVRWIVTRYARTALWLVLLVAATGTLSGLLLVPVDQVLTTEYGRILMVKLALVMLAVILAGTARLTLGSGDDRLRRVRRLARAEAVVLVMATAAAAVLVSAPLPNADAEASPPSPAEGPELPLGTLAGQIGVNVAASQGQLVVRLTTPRGGNYYEPDPHGQQDFELSGALSNPGTSAEDLAFRPCGRGCFVADAALQDGENLVTLRAGASGWRGGDVAMLLPWPVTPAADLLAATVARMQQVEDMTVYETVASDGAAESPPPTEVPIGGSAFLDTEPYGTGVAPITVRSDRHGAVRLHLAFPAEGRTAELVLDEAGRIVEETLTDPKHVILRRFIYPEHG
jgi:copper transport protein